MTHYPFPTYQEETRYLWQYHCEGGDEGSRCDYKWVEQAVVKKSNYFLAGRPIATRITGDPVSGNNGLFYFLTDHLGSTTMLITAAGAAVAGTAAYYQPYGNYRTSPPTTLTERGYTGHHENRDIGLTYMNARYYIPGLGRFLTADTLVPAPANPQSHNRYSYVLGNVLRYTDPTGHECYDPASSGTGDCIGFSLLPLVQFTGVTGQKWTNEEMAIVVNGAWLVAQALFEASGGQFISASEAFLRVFGGTVTFYKTGTKSDADAMGEAKSKNLIHVYNHRTAITHSNAGTMWAAHELGHAFNYALSPNQTEPQNVHGQGLIDLAQKGVWVDGVRISGAISSTSWLGDYTRGDFEGYQSDTFPHIQNPTYSASEDFADMFSNYVHNSFAAGNAGQARYNFMANHMQSWIALAVSNNE